MKDETRKKLIGSGLAVIFLFSIFAFLAFDKPEEEKEDEYKWSYSYLGIKEEGGQLVIDETRKGIKNLKYNSFADGNLTEYYLVWDISGEEWDFLNFNIYGEYEDWKPGEVSKAYAGTTNVYWIGQDRTGLRMNLMPPLGEKGNFKTEMKSRSNEDIHLAIWVKNINASKADVTVALWDSKKTNPEDGITNKFSIPNYKVKSLYSESTVIWIPLMQDPVERKIFG